MAGEQPCLGCSSSVRLTAYREKAFRKREVALARVNSSIGPYDQMALPEAYMGKEREEQYKYGLKWGRPLMEETTLHGNDIFAFETHENALINASPFGLHTPMFIPTIRLQGSVEQQKHWLPLAESGQILGTYAQTELGHGGFVRGLETVISLHFPYRGLALLTGRQDGNL